MSAINNYPIIDGHRQHYVHYPIQDENGQWMPVRVERKGYSEIMFAGRHTDFKACQKACDIHNEYHGWSLSDVHEIISFSMNNCKNGGGQMINPSEKIFNEVHEMLMKANVDTNYSIMDNPEMMPQVIQDLIDGQHDDDYCSSCEIHQDEIEDLNKKITHLNKQIKQGAQ